MISITDNGPSKLKKIKRKYKNYRNINAALAITAFAISQTPLAAGALAISLTAISVLFTLLCAYNHVKSMNTNNAASAKLTNQSSKYASKVQTHKMYKKNPYTFLIVSTISIGILLTLEILISQNVLNYKPIELAINFIQTNLIPIISVTATCFVLCFIATCFLSKKAPQITPVQGYQPSSKDHFSQAIPDPETKTNSFLLSFNTKSS